MGSWAQRETCWEPRAPDLMPLDPSRGHWVEKTIIPVVTSRDAKYVGKQASLHFAQQSGHVNGFQLEVSWFYEHLRVVFDQK